MMNMMWTQKEASLLEDLKAQERICVEKYGKYSQQAKDPQLKQLFAQIQQTEQQHEQTVTQMINGTIPQMNQQGGQQQAQPGQLPAYGQQQSPEKQADAYLCQDALGTEKHVSSVYDVSIFEFRSPQARDVLNHLQKEEQQHGEMIYAYMARNGMSA
ncbi:MAG: spore coat protein [Clostridiales bacterium]|nr:spore coat protein [Clostridiales bacterium]